MDSEDEKKFFERRTKDIQNSKGILFENMGLKSELVAGIRSKKFCLPSPIQEEAIPKILEGRNVLARAKNGTGKTASYLIPIIQMTDPKINEIQSIIIVSTRELAYQTCANCQDLSKFLPIKSYVLTGGKKVSEDLENLKKGIHILITTIGRLAHFIDKDLLNLNFFRIICFDEADVIIGDNLFFLDKISKNVENLQILLFSATFPRSLVSFKDKYMKNAVEVNTMREFTLKGVSQFYAFTEEPNKVACIYALISKLKYNQCIIFCNSVNRVNLLEKKMVELGFVCQSIHSKMSIQQRNSVFEDFKAKKFRILICSDVFYRGIDVESVNIVINFDLPSKSATYLHRIGRSGRFGQYGLGISFVSTHDKAEFLRICQELNTHALPVPIDAQIDEALYVTPIP